MKVLYCSSEVQPFSKTGGLADVSGSLPKALNDLKIEIKVITPYYSVAKFGKIKPKLFKSLDLQIIDRIKTAHYYKLEKDGIEYIFIKCDDYFKRDGLYGYYDEAERFSFFCYAVLEIIPLLAFQPNIIHVNDWQTSLIPYLLDEVYRKKNKIYQRIKTLLSIHNLEYQGAFPIEANLLLPHQDDTTYIHFGKINYLKTGIMRASAINTVSNTYKEEIMTQRFGFTLDGALRSRISALYGITNGIDYNEYNPSADKIIFKTFDDKSFLEGKLFNKKELLRELAITGWDDKPLISFIGRLAHQKGIDLIEGIINNVIKDSDANIILVGSGDRDYEAYFDSLAAKHPTRIKVWIGFNNELARKVYAGSDLFLMPSEFEPCGLGQLIAMRYGTLPVVRETGGLADTVIPYNEFTAEGTGFSFTNYDNNEFKDSVFRALDLYNKNKDGFNELIVNAMTCDNSMPNMAQKYIDLYNQIKKGY